MVAELIRSNAAHPLYRLTIDIERVSKRSRLAAKQRFTRVLRVLRGQPARVVSCFDMLIDRLDESQATGHETPARQVLALVKGTYRRSSRTR